MQFEKLDYIIQGLEEQELPTMFRAKQTFNAKQIKDPAEHLRREFEEKVTAEQKRWLAGKSIGISCGSRGLPHYADIVKTLVEKLKEYGAAPFLFPSMGSHAGATAEGQKAYLAQFGLTEENIGAPVRSTMEVVEVARLDDGFPVYCDRYASEADGVILFNKIKPHTHFKDRHESGLLKMICIGCGKHKGAATFHQYGFDDFCHNMERVSEAFLKNVNVVFSVGLVQNAYDDIGWLEVIPTDRFFEKDAELLEIAKKELAQIKIRDIDVLIIDEVGKNISGMGFDPNVMGRIDVRSQMQAFRDMAPDIRKIVLLDINKESHGLGIGLGNADLISFRFVNKLDFAATYTNAVTNNYLQAAASMPMYANSDSDAIKIAIITSMTPDKKHPKVVRIKNTVELSEIEISEACLPQIEGKSDIRVVSEGYKWELTPEGNLW